MIAQSRKPLIFVAIFLSIVFCLDVFFSKSIKSSDFNKVWWEWSKKDGKFDYLILGNSRSLTSFNTSKLNKEWKKKGLNLSLEDAQISTQYLILKYFLENNNNETEVLLLNLDFWGLNSASIEDSRVWCFLPYIRNDLVFEHFRKTYPYKSYVWRYIPFYKYADYNSKIGIFTVANTYLNLARKPFDEYGDRLKSGSFVDQDSTRINFNYRIDYNSGAIFYLEKIFKLAKEHDIKVFTFTTPVYELGGNEKNKAEMFKQLDQDLFSPYMVRYIDFSELYDQDKKDFFYDQLHLNRRGAAHFTNYFSEIAENVFY